MHHYLFTIEFKLPVSSFNGDKEDINPNTKESVCVVILTNGTMIITNKSWVENSNSSKSRIFYSPNFNADPVFIEPLYYFKQDTVGCYYGRVHKFFGKYT